jgi:hypothetical protein
VKLLVEAKEWAALADDLQRRGQDGDMLVASLLLHTELHRAANRRPEYIGREAVSEVLSAIALVDIENGDLTTAPLPPGRRGRELTAGEPRGFLTRPTSRRNDWYARTGPGCRCWTPPCCC